MKPFLENKKGSFVEVPVLTNGQIRAMFDRIIREQQHCLLNSQKQKLVNYHEKNINMSS